MVTVKQKAKLAEIEKIKKEIVAMGGTLDYTEKDLDKLEVAKIHLKNERNELDKFSMTLGSQGKARLAELNEIIPKLEIQLRVDRTNLQLKKKGVKVIDEGFNGFSVKKVGRSNITFFD